MQFLKWRTVLIMANLYLANDASAGKRSGAGPTVPIRCRGLTSDSSMTHIDNDPFYLSLIFVVF